MMKQEYEVLDKVPKTENGRETDKHLFPLAPSNK